MFGDQANSQVRGNSSTVPDVNGDDRQSSPTSSTQSTASAQSSPSSGPSHVLSPPSVSLPKGGGAIRGIGEKLSANPFTGSATFTIPIFTSPGRAGFQPELNLTYSAGSGNSPFGLGWSLSVPSITRKTDKGLPQYRDEEDSDEFILSGAEDLVPQYRFNKEDWLLDERSQSDGQSQEYIVRRYRPRTEGLFARIERWTNKADGTVHWRSTSKDNITSIYGMTRGAQMADPQNGQRIFQWLLEETRDAKGNLIKYIYKTEDFEGIENWREVQDDSQPSPYALAHEQHRVAKLSPATNRYLKYICYGNRTPYNGDDWLFYVVFDYGDHNLDVPPLKSHQPWPLRQDAFSTYRAGFDVRTRRLCRRVLMFHHFSDDPNLGPDPCLVRSTDFTYRETPVASYLIAATQTGYRKKSDKSYHKKSFPPIELTYTEVAFNDRVQTLKEGSLNNLPTGLSGGQYQLVDLDGEGLPGILTEQAEGWYYKRNRGEGQFSPVAQVSTKPTPTSLRAGQPQFMDLAGDGQQDLVVLDHSLPGFFERNDKHGWQTFRAFTHVPQISWQDPNLRFVDLTGDGHADLLITEDDAFVWYQSEAEEGFANPHIIRRLNDEATSPNVVFADGTQMVFLADLSGDGLSDLARIRNGDVCYWPNLGYGRFGAKVTMDHPPVFDLPEFFDPTRIRLADVDGSGTTDILYLGRNGVSMWFNQSGNKWSEPRHLKNFPLMDTLASVQVTDLLGKGTACLVWSSSLATVPGGQLKYIDLMGGIKPHLLTTIVNNLGLETRLSHAPSTKFYLEDREAGRPWITRLPFPVHLLERVETIDHISRTKLVTRYRYHHGYFDGEEREFRGFGMVEQEDAETFNEFVTQKEEDPEFTNFDQAYHAPPVLTKTWFHPGAFVAHERISRLFEEEYFREDPVNDPTNSRAPFLPDTLLPTEVRLPEPETAVPWLLSPQEAREACRALRGQVLRQEVYGRDETGNSHLPYTVSERNYELVVLQPHMSNTDHAVFFSHPRETLDFHYERNPQDPRVAHQINLQVDAWGNITDTVTIGYPRRQADHVQQQHEQITYTNTKFIPSTVEKPFHYAGIPYETRMFEITGFQWTWGNPTTWLTHQNFQEIIKNPDEFKPYEWERPQGAKGLAKRIIEWTRTYFRADKHAHNLDLPQDTTHRLPLGQIDALGLPYETYAAAFSKTLYQTVYGPRVTPALLKEGGYHQESDQPAYWWIPSGRQAFIRNFFYQPDKTQDSLGNIHAAGYDNYELLVISTKDPVGNVVEVVNDYRVLQPSELTDPNKNRTQVAFDTLGIVVGTAVMGKDPAKDPTAQREGDSFETFPLDITDEQIQKWFNHHDPETPFRNAHLLLGTATTRIIYDLNRFVRTRRDKQQTPQPIMVYTLARETHVSKVPAGEKTKIQHHVTYSDGLGREIQSKVQAEAGEVDGKRAKRRWVGSGWTILNNKGNPVKQYEPFFSHTHAFEFAKVQGVSSTFFYDPLERVVATLHPNHTYEKVMFDPWKQETWDVNDTVLQTDPRNDPHVGHFFQKLADRISDDHKEHPFLPTWYVSRFKGIYGEWEKNAAKKTESHAATPTVTYFDTLGRPFLTVADNGKDKKGKSQQYKTIVELDIEGNQRSIIDARGVTVMRYAYDMLSQQIHQDSVDAGKRWVFVNVLGNPIRQWDSRQQLIETTYDALQRSTHRWVILAKGKQPILIERIVYGEAYQDKAKNPPERWNLRGQVYQQYDTAGRSINTRYDFKGNLWLTERQVATTYKEQVQWNAIQKLSDKEVITKSPTNLLEETKFKTSTSYDALNRPTHIITFDGSETHPTYNEANLLEALGVRIRVDNNWTWFVKNVEYNEKGQRLRIDYANNTSTHYTYDEKTFRLSQMRTTRTTDKATLQDLNYTYDPAGNITSVIDKAQQKIFFKGQVVSPDAHYVYDPLYRLIEAQGREHRGQNGGGPSSSTGPYDWNDHARINRAHPQDGKAMRSYFEFYHYDPVGNILQMIHKATNGNWTRQYGYETNTNGQPKNNRLLNTTLPGDKKADEKKQRYKHDAHGNMLTMPHLPSMQWDFADRLVVVDLQGGGKAYYTYDASGQRVRKVVEKNKGTLIEERIYLGPYERFQRSNSKGTIQLERETLHVTDDQQRIALIETKTVDSNITPFTPKSRLRFQLNNHLGSSGLEFDEKGQEISYEEYYPYGSTSYQGVKSNSEVSQKRYRYSGKERDEETGLYYYGARYYAPSMAIWTSADPIGIEDSINLFNYVRENPIVRVDETGLQSQEVDKEVLGFLEVIEERYFFYEREATKALEGVKNAPKIIGNLAAEALQMDVVSVLGEESIEVKYSSSSRVRIDISIDELAVDIELKRSLASKRSSQTIRMNKHAEKNKRILSYIAKDGKEILNFASKLDQDTLSKFSQFTDKFRTIPLMNFRKGIEDVEASSLRKKNTRSSILQRATSDSPDMAASSLKASRQAVTRRILMGIPVIDVLYQQYDYKNTAYGGGRPLDAFINLTFANLFEFPLALGTLFWEGAKEQGRIMSREDFHPINDFP